MDSKFFLNNVVMVNFNSMLEVMYKALYDFIVDNGGDNGGYIDLRDCKGKDKIYSLEFVSGGEVVEWNVIGVMVENGDIYYCAEYGFDYEGCDMSKSIDTEGDWFSLKFDDHYYIQTMYNICESISQYVKED